MFKQKARMSKRLLAGLIDWSMCLLLAFGLFFYPANAIFSKVFHADELKADNYNLMLEYKIIYIDENGEYQYTEAGKDESNEVYEAYHNDEKYKSLKNTEYLLTLTELGSSLIVSETLLFLIMPLILRNGQTIGKKINRIILTDDCYIKVKFLNVFLRYLTILFIESIASLFTYGVPLILTFIIMCITKDHRTVHDYLSATRVIEKGMTVFLNPADRLEFDESNAINEVDLTK
ncbi:MAG: RDD family protein [Bacilli bacterium]